MAGKGGTTGRRPVDPVDKVAIARRLREHLGETKRSEEDFADRIRLSRRTVINWLTPNKKDPEKQKVPDHASLIEIGRKEGLNIDWLLLGRGRRVWQPPLAEDSGLGDEVRSHLVDQLDGSGIHPNVINGVIPEGGQLLQDITDRYSNLAKRGQGLPGGLKLALGDPGTVKELADTRELYAKRIEDMEQQLTVVELLLERAELVAAIKERETAT